MDGYTESTVYVLLLRAVSIVIRCFCGLLTQSYMYRKALVLILTTVLLIFVASRISEAVQNKMYWIEQVSDKVRCANLDGSNVQDLVTIGLNSPYGIALDVSSGKVYWTDWEIDTIKCANLNGTNVETLISGT